MAINVLVISDYRDFHQVRPEAEIFIGLAKLGFNVHVMTYPEASYISEFKKAGITVVDFHPQKRLNKSEIKRIREYLITHQIDILQLYNNDAIINGIQAAKGLDLKVVLYRGFAGNIQWYDPTSYFKFLHPRVDKIVCNAKVVEDYIHSQLFFDKSKTITISKRHDIKWYQNYESLDIKKELGLNRDDFLLVNVANNRKMKGIPYLLKAMGNLPQDLPIHLLLVGRDMDDAENMKIIKQYKLQNKVHFWGFTKDPLNIVASCDVFVLSSIFGESITKAVVEAMSVGVVPIISDIAGNRDLVVHNENGLVFKAKDVEELSQAILKLYKQPELRKKLASKTKYHIQTNLNIDQTIWEFKALYESLVTN